MINFRLPLLLLGYCLILACGSSRTINGLWQVEKVQVGKEEMTPVARWTELHPDYTQVSGNGWLQHSVGTWNYNQKQNELRIINLNGIKDNFGPFRVQLGENNMIWTRMEEGQEVAVFLKRVDQIPTAPANQLLGIWGLSAASDRDREISESNKKQAYFFFRWDHIFRQGDVDGHFQLGAYKTHSHRNELELFYYGDPVKYEQWTFELIDYSTLRLQRETRDSIIRQEYERLDFLPN